MARYSGGAVFARRHVDGLRLKGDRFFHQRHVHASRVSGQGVSEQAQHRGSPDKGRNSIIARRPPCALGIGLAAHSRASRRRPTDLDHHDNAMHARMML